MLDTIREYASEGLSQSGSLHDCQAQHARYFADLVADDAPNVMRHNQRDCVERLFQETGNIRAALDWLMKQSERGRDGQAILRAEMVLDLPWPIL